MVESAVVKLHYVPTEQIPVDIVTKGIRRPKYRRCSENLDIKVFDE